MRNEIQIEGFLGSYEPPKPSDTTNSHQTNKTEQIVNVQVSKQYPQTGERPNSYLIFSGICLLLLLIVVIKGDKNQQA